MPKPVCVKCEVEIRTHKMGVYLLEMAGEQPYRVWMADVGKCPGCGVEVVTGYGERPVMERYEAGFADYLLQLAKIGKNIIRSFERVRGGVA